MLHQKPYRSRLSLLRRLVALGEPMTALGLSDVLPSQRATKHNLASFASGLLKDFVKAGLVTRARRQYSYWYLPTELGVLILDYLPAEEDTHEVGGT